MNTVDIFNTLAPESPYVPLMLGAIKVMDRGVDVWAAHLSGSDNVVADSLSLSLFDIARASHPNLSISASKPPRDELGERVI